MELDEFDFQKAVEDGMEVVITYPADNKAKGVKAGEPSDMKIKVKGVGSEAFKKGIALFNAYLEKCKKDDVEADEEVNNKKLEAINDMLKVTFANGIYTGTLNQNSSVDEQALLDAIVNTAKDSGNYECSEIDIEDLDDVNIEVTVPVKLTDLLKGDGYQLMTNIDSSHIVTGKQIGRAHV